MASCERCWTDSTGNVERYFQLVGERSCTPEEQAGLNAERCAICDRKTVHQHARICMVHGCSTLTNETLT